MDDGIIGISNPLEGEIPSKDNHDSFIKINESYTKNVEYSQKNLYLTRSYNKVLNSPLNSDVYNFNHKNRGKAIIINNRDFHSYTNLTTRVGTDQDAKLARETFAKLGFDVLLYENLSSSQMTQLLSLVSTEDFSNSDCFVCLIMSHGEDGYIWGTDNTLKLQQLTAKFRGDCCKSLIGKPKLFFVQACRGTLLDDGVEHTDNDEVDAKVIHRIPVESDFLIVYSSVEGYYSWRNCSDGSWFIQSLCNALLKYVNELDILRILTRVNRMVGEFESNTADPEWHKKKQSPSIVSMLTKDLYFIAPN